MPSMLFLLVAIATCHHSGGVVAAAAAATEASRFNLRTFGVRGDGKTDDSQAFMKAFKTACNAVGDVKLLVPGGTYLVGPMKFGGPCKQASSITFNMEGSTLKATTNLAKYGDAWVDFRFVDGLKLIGGTFDGQGKAAWPLNSCPKSSTCKLLPTSLKFTSMNHTTVTDVTSLHSKFFHVALVGCEHFKGTGIKITAPANSPNTDGIHIEACRDVTIRQASIATGDDCVSIGHGNSQVLITDIRCGPGHGISVGSLGKYSYEKDVRGLVVKDSTITGTTNGLRIKTWGNSPGAIVATNITFENIIMNNVANPIIIDQNYCPYAACPTNAVPSRVKISDIFFKNIRGTTSTPTAVILDCSRKMPCQNVQLHDVRLKHPSGISSIATCSNVKATYVGAQLPPPCVQGS